MKYLTIETQDPDLRATAHGWGWEDTCLVDTSKAIGLSPSGHAHQYDCPLLALADGYELLGPPTPVNRSIPSDRPDYRWSEGTFWVWWMKKDCKK